MNVQRSTSYKDSESFLFFDSDDVLTHLSAIAHQLGARKRERRPEQKNGRRVVDPELVMGLR